jgi:hypothetical protein
MSEMITTIGITLMIIVIMLMLLPTLLMNSLSNMFKPNYLKDNDRLHLAIAIIRDGNNLNGIVDRVQQLERVKYIIEEEIKKQNETENGK